MRQEIKDEFQAIIESLNNFMDRINKEGSFTCDIYVRSGKKDIFRLDECKHGETVDSVEIVTSESFYG